MISSFIQYILTL